jgi:hypothetical protein
MRLRREHACLFGGTKHWQRTNTVMSEAKLQANSSGKVFATSMLLLPSRTVQNYNLHPYPIPFLATIHLLYSDLSASTRY